MAINNRSAAKRPINYRAAPIKETKLLDQRIIEGYAVVWADKNLHSEIFYRGAFQKSINEHGPASESPYKIKFLYGHDRALSLIDELYEDETGLYFRTKPLDDIKLANEVLLQVRSGTLNNFSFGFNYVKGKVFYEESSDTIHVHEAALFEISILPIPSGLNSFAIRSADPDKLAEETELFIKKIPKELQLEARAIISKNIALAEAEPVPPLERNKPQIDYQFLTKNLKLQ